MRTVLLAGVMAFSMLATGCEAGKRFAHAFGEGMRDTAQGYPSPRLDPDLPPAYVAGFQDGYHSAHRPDLFAKDLDAYAADALYQQGWDDGHNSGVLAAHQQAERQKAQAAEKQRQELQQIQRQLDSLEHKESFRAMQRGELP